MELNLTKIVKLLDCIYIMNIIVYFEHILVSKTLVIETKWHYSIIKALREKLPNWGKSVNI